MPHELSKNEDAPEGTRNAVKRFNPYTLSAHCTTCKRGITGLASCLLNQILSTYLRPEYLLHLSCYMGLRPCVMFLVSLNYIHDLIMVQVSTVANPRYLQNNV